MKTLFVLLVVAATLFAVVPARADASPEAPPERAIFALVVTSNKSQKLSRPDLHYADDDGARYYELFTNLAPHADVTLLTTFDRDSAKLFADLVPKASPPTVAAVRSGFAAMRRRVMDATARGARADFYFVFAGHGDVEEGRGFIELEDGRLVSDDLTSLVASVPSTRTHVILDSCNSFFVINARKPGGHRFATGAEAGEKLNKSLPNVGVFLSTSAEAETFEWSELGAGIFSHAVRSGLAGAADANHDSEISYEELAAFVHTATKDVKNPRFRPNVFARGPSGHNGEPIVNLTAATAKLTIPKHSGRVTVRDADGLPWVDAHFEGDREETIYVPPRVAKDVQLFVDGKDAQIAARGAGDVFRTLFAQPFGPAELERYRHEVASEPPPVYGVSGDDVLRMNELLRQAADNARADRYLQALGFAGVGALYGAVGLHSRLEGERTGGDVVLMGYGGVALALGAFRLARPSREEDAYEWFTRARARSGASPDLMATAEARLFALAKRDREERLFWRYFGIVEGVGSVTTMALAAQHEARLHHPNDAFFWGATAFVTAVGFAIPVIGTFSPTRTERLAELWEKDPSRVRLDPSAASPTTIRLQFGLGSFGLGGTF